MKILKTTAVVATALFALAACGGGGSSPNPGSGSGGAAGTGSGITTTQSFTKTQTRSEAQTTLSAYSLASPNSLSAAAVARTAMSMRGGRRTLAVANCLPSGAGSETVVNVTNADGSQTLTDTVYYDTACKTPRSVEVITVASVNVTTATGTGTVTLFDINGNVTSFESLTLTLIESATITTVTLTERVGPNAAAPPISQEGTTCTAQTAAPSNMACGDATVLAGASGSSGVSINETQSTTSSATAETLTASLYSAPSLGIAPGVSPIWNVTGAAAFSTVTGTLTINLGSTGLATGGAVSVTDTVSGVSISGTVSATGVSLTVKQGTTTLATVTLDALGNGTITYADGSTESVTGYVIHGT